MFQLGKKIVQELKLDETSDTLARWMAHYIAELIEAAETASAEDQPAKFEKCAAMILEVWGRRHDFPNNKRALERFEPILRTLENLSVDEPRYFRAERSAANEDEESEETNKWLQRASAVDQAAKATIGYCLTRAAESALDESKEWVALADAARVGDTLDLLVIRFIGEASEHSGVSTADDRARDRLKDQLAKFDEFKKIARRISADLRGRLKKLDP